MTVTELPTRAIALHDPLAPSRWVPTRAGILNVWRYYDEVFTFHDGRLLLRGPNGSGKSKALELLLPFLFDANLRSSRLSTFGTGERSMHWNLMGQGASGTTRVGYVWLEFRLPGAAERWFTCGARLQASTHTTTVHADYFTTELRVGEPAGLALTDDADRPLTKRGLEERLGERGTVHGNAGDHRAAVRSALFPSLSEQRFEALITALLQLRTPKLSQRLDPGLLSTLLSRALPPLGDKDIADLAEGFERLDAQRERLAALDREVDAARTLADRQRRYAQRVLRAAAARLISATTELDNLTKAARRSAEEYERVAEERVTAQTRAETVDRDLTTAQTRRSALVDSEAYQQGRELDQLREQAAAATRAAGRIRVDADRLRSLAGDDETATGLAEAEVRARLANVQAQESEVQNAASRAGMLSVHGELAALLDAGGPRGRQLLRAAVRSRHEQLEAVGRALDEHERAVGRREAADDDLEQARAALSAAGDALDATSAARDAALDELRAEVVGWLGGCRELAFPDLDRLLDTLASEARLLAEVDSVATAVLQEITTVETTRRAEQDTVRAERERLVAELDAITAARDLPPPAPPTRTTDRTTIPGAPLWRLVDFADSTPDHAHAGIEAALQASGILDAWLGPRGEIQGHDVFAEPESLAPVAGRSLADVLVPEPDAAVPATAVRRLLSAVAYGDQLPAGSPAAIGADGRWRIGNLTGSWHKNQPDYVGALARQRAQDRRAAGLRAQIADCDGRLTTLDVELTALADRRLGLAAERAARPSHDPVNVAITAHIRAESDVAGAESTVRHRVETVSRWEGRVAAALRDLSRIAAEHGLPTQRPALSTLTSAVRSFEEQASSWLTEHDGLRSARQLAEQRAGQAARSAEQAAGRDGEAVEAEQAQRELAVRLAAVESTIGADYRDVLREIQALREAERNLKAEQRDLRGRLDDLSGRLGGLDQQRSTDAGVRDQATGVRDSAAQRFRHLATGALPADCRYPDLPAFARTISGSEGVRAALDAARLVAAEWPTTPHAANHLGDALARLTESVHDCRQTLSARADLDLATDEDVQVFTAVIDGATVGAAGLMSILTEEARRSALEITDSERDLFDRTLTGDTRRHLAARIRQANELVDAMNARLERVRTASRVAVRLVWQVAADLPAGSRAARDLLLREPRSLSETDRESLHRFFRDRIEQARTDDTAGSWAEQLAQVFDYTDWHQFVVKVDRADGEGWQVLTKKLHGALSGGEKAIALHLPLFAAVAAHYQAAPEAPRVILLDEVFVGVDSANRGQVFALLSALDLDLMLTSDHEWCTYAELSGIAIHQLITADDGDDAVTTARFTWDGYDLQPDDHPG